MEKLEEIAHYSRTGANIHQIKYSFKFDFKCYNDLSEWTLIVCLFVRSVGWLVVRLRFIQYFAGVYQYVESVSFGGFQRLSFKFIFMQFPQL